MSYTFTDKDKVSISSEPFVKLTEKAGTSIQGTYVKQSENMNKMNGEMQTVFHILLEDGTARRVSGNAGLNNQMANIKLGQIIEIKFAGKEMSKKTGKPFNVFNVYARPDLVNKNWVKEYAEVKSSEPSDDKMVEYNDVVSTTAAVDDLDM